MCAAPHHVPRHAPRAANVAGLLLTVLGLGAGLAIALPVAGQTPAASVTTDTPEYCSELRARVDELLGAAGQPPSVEIARLTGEGRAMCDHGQTKGGILRLRRALMLIRHPDGSDGESTLSGN